MPYLCLPVGSLETNCYIVYDRNNVGAVIDPGAEAQRILNSIGQYNLNIKYVMLTHVHFDHLLAAADILKSTGAELLVPGADARALTDTKRSLLHFAGMHSIALKADRLLDDGDVVEAGELKLQVLHTPGHTPGSSCYTCGDLLLSGDTLFLESIGRTDFPGGDSAAMCRSLKRLSELKGDYMVLPGHGPSTTLMDEKSGNPYMNSAGYDINY